MGHAVPLITTLAAAFGLALIFGFIAARLKLPALVGYLVAGIIIGPATPGFVADVEIARQLAEIGVMLLMFGVGLHLSFDDLLSVRKIALPGAFVQMAAATALGAAIATHWGWPLMSAIVFGLSLSVASTVVLFKALERKNLLESVNGRVAIGWLVVQDLAMVLLLVLLPPLADLFGKPGSAPSGSLALTLGKTFAEVVLFADGVLQGGLDHVGFGAGVHEGVRSREETSDEATGCTCRPHSLALSCSHHQRPARKSSPTLMARVQGAQPMLGWCCSFS